MQQRLDQRVPLGLAGRYPGRGNRSGQDQSRGAPSGARPGEEVLPLVGQVRGTVQEPTIEVRLTHLIQAHAASPQPVQQRDRGPHGEARVPGCGMGGGVVLAAVSGWVVDGVGSPASPEHVDPAASRIRTAGGVSSAAGLGSVARPAHDVPRALKV